MSFFTTRYTVTVQKPDPYERGKTREEKELDLAKLLRDGGYVLVALIALLYCWPFYSVPTGSRAVLTQFGAIRGIEPEGLAIVLPWQKITLFSIRAEQADIKDASGATSDTQPVDTSLTVRYSIYPEKVSEVFEKYSHTGDLQNYVQTATAETFKAVTAKYTAVDLIAKRVQVRNDVIELLREKLTVYGAQVISVDMTNFSFTSKEYMNAINDKVTQEQKLLAAQNTVKTTEAQQRAKVVTAEADANARKAMADGEAYAITATATANAKASLSLAQAAAEGLRIQNDVLAKSKDVLELRRIEVDLAARQKWDGKLPEAMYATVPLPFINAAPSAK